MINVMIADDHPIVRRGLRGIIEDVAGMRLVGEVADGYQVLAQIQERDVDVVILDISMPGPGFLDVLRQLREEKPTARVLVLSLHPEELYAVRALRAGAAGYLTKDHTTEQLAAAVKHVHAGHRYVTPSLADRLASGLEEDPTRPRHEQLSDREFEVLRLLASGFGVTDIGRELALSPKTISTYRTRILEKMQVSSNAELVRYAVEHGLL